MLVFLRWSLSSNESYPFCFEVKENTKIGELCNMVMCKNNQWLGNPTFSVVKIYGDDKKLLDDDSKINILFDQKDDLYLDFVAG